MLEIILSLLALILLVKAVVLLLKISWGLAKGIATVLLVLSIPVYIFCLVCAGGAALIVPLVLLCCAIGALKLLRSF